MQENSPVLPRIHGTEDVRKLNMEELEQLCRDVRARLLQTVSQTGGHLSSNLGVVELTVALHHTFCLPHDQIVWDVGHQCYTHKLLTGRNDRFDTLRQEGGLSGFPCPAESPCDVFVAGHSSTSVSAALGMAEAKALSGDDGYVVAVIGDGALTGGLAYEGLSNAGRSKDRLIVILNDNGMSINANVGFVARHLAVLRARPSYLRLKNGFARAVRHIPLIGKPLHRALLHTKMNLKRSLYKESSWFEQLGFYYLGPIDGHSLPALLNALQSAREITGPVLLHVETKKGKGYTPAERSPDRFHGVSPFDPATGETAPPPSVSFSHVFGEELTRLAEKDSRICAITAAMTDGTGLSEFARRFRNRCFDVGIAEEHAVTFASGLARNGMLPIFAVYSPFLQRCYDQLLNDTALNHTHIVLAVDRAGAVPDDGETHQGIFDVPLLFTIPGVTVFSPATYGELRIQLHQAIYDTPGIAVVRYPKGQEWPIPVPFRSDGSPYTLWEKPDADAVLLSYGRLFATAAQAAEGHPVSLVKLNRLFPRDEQLICALLRYKKVLIAEEGSAAGGVGQEIAAELTLQGYTGRVYVRAVTHIPSVSKVPAALVHAGLDTDSLAGWIGACCHE